MLKLLHKTSCARCIKMCDQLKNVKNTLLFLGALKKLSIFGMQVKVEEHKTVLLRRRWKNLDSLFAFLVKWAIPVVSPLMRGGATSARFPQWALMVGGPAVSSGATLALLCSKFHNQVKNMSSFLFTGCTFSCRCWLIFESFIIFMHKVCNKAML